MNILAIAIDEMHYLMSPLGVRKLGPRHFDFRAVLRIEEPAVFCGLALAVPGGRIVTRRMGDRFVVIPGDKLSYTWTLFPNRDVSILELLRALRNEKCEWLN